MCSREMVIEFDAARGGKVSTREIVNITQVIGD
jgi:hypothetical protein